MVAHRGVHIPDHLADYAQRVPEDILKSLTPVDLVARCVQAEHYAAEARAANARRSHTIAKGYRELADEVLTAAPDTAENRAEAERLLGQARITGGDVAKGYRERAAELTAGTPVDERFVSEARRLLGNTSRDSSRTTNLFK